MKKIIPATLTILLLCSHDMFLKVDRYFLPPQTDAIIQLYNGTFEKSENVITRDRMIDVSLVGQGKRIAVDSTQWFDLDNTTYLNFKTGGTGTWVAGVSTASRVIDMTAEDFNDYLDHDGVLDMLSERKENGTLNTDARERYSKHVKTIFQVGEQLSADWKTYLGYPIEFIPLENPYDIHTGHSLKVKLLRDGSPLTNQLVYLGHDHSEHEHEHEHEHDHGNNHSHEGHEGHTHNHEGIKQLRTDENGIVEFKIESSGIWYLRTIHLVTSDEENLTHESNWATLTFAIGDGHTHGEDHGHSHAHDEEDEGFPSSLFLLGSIVLIVVLYIWFSRRK
jgi:hypothetical protein